MLQILKTPALVLHGIRWSESSKIVHLFTSEKGYVKAIARGALRPKSPFRGILENLNQVEVILNIKEGRGLQHLAQASLLNPFSQIRENLEATAVAYAICELLRSTVRENEPSQTLFNFTVQLLNELNTSLPAPALLFLIRYLLHLSHLLGFAWNLQQCGVCKKPPQNFPLRADIVNGSIYCNSCAPHVQTKTVPLSLQQWRLLKSLHQASPSPPWPTEIAFSPLIDLLLSHLSYHTEQNLQLKSLKLYLR